MNSNNHLHYSSLSYSNCKLSDYPALIEAFLDVKEAASVSNLFEVGVSPEDVKKIRAATSKLKQILNEGPSENLRSIFPSDPLVGGGSIAMHLNILAALRDETGLPDSILNRSQSTADICHTAFRIAIYRQSEALLQQVKTMIAILESQARNWRNIRTLGRTCLQDALPISLGDSWENYSEALKRRLLSIQSLREKLMAINLGGTVLGSRANASENYLHSVVKSLSDITGLSWTHRNSLYDAAQNSDDLGEYHSSIAQLTQVLMKLARDLRLLASGPQGGMGEIQLPPSIQSSSFFSGKNNPILPESLLLCGFQILGADHSIQIALQNAELSLNVFEGSIGIQCLNSLQMLTNCLEKFILYCLIDIQPNRKRCESLSRFEQTSLTHQPGLHEMRKDG